MAYLIDVCPHCSRVIELAPPAQRHVLRMACEDLAAQLDFPAGSGRRLSRKLWTKVMVASWQKEKIDADAIVLPELDGDDLDLLFMTAPRLAKEHVSEVIEFTYAYGAGRGVRFRERQAA